MPTNDRFKSYEPFYPGPGRYYPYDMSCTCDSRLSSSFTDKINSATKRAEYIKKCDEPRERQTRQITGVGHTSVFKSQTERLLKKPQVVKRLNVPIEIDNAYTEMIMNPIRKPLFSMDLQSSTTKKIRFCSIIERRPKRAQLRNNKKVAFFSCCQRFPIDKTSQHFYESKISVNIKKNTKLVLEPAIQKKTNIINLMNAKERLQILPKRFVDNKPKPDVSNKFKNIFNTLPTSRIPLNKLIINDSLNVDLVHQPLNLNEFLQDKYI